jgi:hypothetical protein
MPSKTFANTVCLLLSHGVALQNEFEHSLINKMTNVSKYKNILKVGNNQVVELCTNVI